MKKILITVVMLAFSNAMLAFSPSSLLDSHSFSNNSEKLVAGHAICKRHCRQGPTGPTGPTGPQGPIGPPAPSFATFISLFALAGTTGQQVIEPEDPILFDAFSAKNGSITWPGANNGEIIISTAGTYQISFGIQPFFGGSISLRVNNVNVPGGTIVTDLSFPFSGLTMDVVIPTNNSTISLVNTGTANLILQAALLPNGDIDPNATIAFIEIHRIL